MAHHIRIGIVGDHQPDVLITQVFCQRVGDRPRAHLRLEIVGRHVLRRGNQNALFTGKFILFAAVKEVSHMSIFLGLGDAQLPNAGLTGNLSENSVDLPRRVGNRNFESFVVPGHRHIGREINAALARKFFEILLDQRTGQLARAIGAEVEKDHPVTVAN